jgi:ribonuclease P protein component
VPSATPLQHVDPATGGKYPKAARVLRTAEFRNIYDNGVRLSTPLFAAFCLSRPESEPGAGARLGLTVPRAVGKSVQRNRIKRRLREAFRLNRARFGCWDIVLNPRRAVLDASFAEIERALEKVIHRCPA